MTVGKLVLELSKWPADAEVACITDKDGKVHPIVRVGGLSGSHVSGRDSIVVVEFK